MNAPDAPAAAMRLGPFQHHPEIDFDFCIEVEDLTGYAYEVRTGMNFMPGQRSQWPFWTRLSRALRFARTDADHLDDQSRAAIPLLHSLEDYALRRDDRPITALPVLVQQEFAHAAR